MDHPDPDTELTDDHMRLLEWLAEHPSGSLTTAAQDLGLQVDEVEALLPPGTDPRCLRQMPVTCRQPYVRPSGAKRLRSWRCACSAPSAVAGIARP